MDNSSYFFYFLLASLAILLSLYWDRLWISPILAIFNRWIRWFTIALGGASMISMFELSTRPFWILMAIAFLSWFLIETIYNWFAIAALSKSALPLFPTYEENENGDQWPAQKHFIQLREWLREEGFTPLKAIRATIAESIALRLSIYQNAAGTVRLQVMFLPSRGGDFSVCYVISSLGSDGFRLITDNYYLPFGGFYPKNWSVERRPWIRALPHLFRRHQKRMKKSNIPFVPWEEDPLIDLNDQQRILEAINTDLGFLVPRHLRDEFGKITFDGRYRFWKELWFLNYFGHPFVVP